MPIQEEREGSDITCDEDMFGPPRTEPAARPKLSMISARLRANEARKRVIDISSKKLENLMDPARNLRRAVCINNTYSRLSEDARKDKEERRKRAREECDDSNWIRKKARREVEDECMALLNAIPELGEPGLGCGQLARLPLPAPALQTPLTLVLDS